MMEVIKDAIGLVCRWYEKGTIKGVVAKDNSIITKKFKDHIEDQIFK